MGAAEAYGSGGCLGVVHARTDEIRSAAARHNDWDLAAKATNQKTSDSSVERFCSAPSSNSVADKDGDPTFQAHPTAEAIGGPHQKSALTQPVNRIGRGAGSPAECNIAQNSQIAHVEITLHP
jgi:hypothetical protein